MLHIKILINDKYTKKRLGKQPYRAEESQNVDPHIYTNLIE